MRAGLVVYRPSSNLDSIDEYSRRLVTELRAAGQAVAYATDGLTPALRQAAGAVWVLLQYNAFSYGHWGVAPGLVRDAVVLRRRLHVPLALMVHEAWMPMVGWRHTLMGAYHRVQLRTLLRFTDVVLTSTQALADEIGSGAVHVPVGSNITPVEVETGAARARLGLGDELVVALFGRNHPGRALDHAEAALAALGREATVLNLGAGAPELAVPAGMRQLRPGRRPAEDVSLALRASDLLLAPFTDGVSTRRTTLMAALAHGLPVVGLRGHNTDRVLLANPDALTMTAVGDRHAYARAVAALAADPARRHTQGAAGLALYRDQFDWPVVARRVVAALR